jgi:ribosomal protein L37E
MSVVKKCVFNCHIDCEDHNKCSSCGWNPEIERVRKEKLQVKFGYRENVNIVE